MKKLNKKTTADYLDFDKCLNTANKILKNEKKYKIAFLVIVGINCGLRYSDLKKLKFEDLENQSLTLIEQKTKKTRTIEFNENVMNAFTVFKERCSVVEGNLFSSNRKTLFSTQYINREIKKMFGKTSLNISTHALRKTFGRRVWDNNGQTDTALVYLSEIFNHSSISTTRLYLGIRQEELKNIYLNL